MIDFLVGLAQGLCLIGLVYGAYLCITYSEAERPRMGERADPLTGHIWLIPLEDRRHPRA